MFTFLIPRRRFRNSPPTITSLSHYPTAHATDKLDGATKIKTYNTSSGGVNGCIDVTSDQIIFVKISVVVFSYYQANSTYRSTQSLISAKFCVRLWCCVVYSNVLHSSSHHFEWCCGKPELEINIKSMHKQKGKKELVDT